MLQLLKLYSVSGKWMSMEHPWNDIEKGKLKYLVKTCRCHSVHHKSHKDRSGIEAQRPR
jgi:hypothetical protein